MFATLHVEVNKNGKTCYNNIISCIDKTIKDLENEKAKLYKYLENEIAEKQKLLTNELQSLDQLKSEIETQKTNFENIFGNDNTQLSSYNDKSGRENKIFESFEKSCNSYTSKNKEKSITEDDFTIFTGYSDLIEEKCNIVKNLTQQLDEAKQLKKHDETERKVNAKTPTNMENIKKDIVIFNEKIKDLLIQVKKTDLNNVCLCMIALNLSKTLSVYA